MQSGKIPVQRDWLMICVSGNVTVSSILFRKRAEIPSGPELFFDARFLTIFFTSVVLIYSKSKEDITLCFVVILKFCTNTGQKIVRSVRYLSFIYYVFAVQSEECRKIFLVLAFISNLFYSRPSMPYIRLIFIKLVGIVLYFCLPDKFFKGFYYTILNLHLICHEGQFRHLGLLVNYLTTTLWFSQIDTTHLKVGYWVLVVCW